MYLEMSLSVMMTTPMITIWCLEWVSLCCDAADAELMPLEISWRSKSINNIRLHKTEMTILITSATHIGNRLTVCARMNESNYPTPSDADPFFTPHSERPVSSHVMVHDGCRRLWGEKWFILLQCFICFISWKENPMKWWKIELD